MGAFEERAGRAGYDTSGRAMSGMAGSQARDEDRRRTQGQKNVIRQAQKNARDALKYGDMEAWTKWSAVAGGTTSAIPDSDQLNKNAAAMVFRNTNDAANMRPAGAPTDPNQPASQQPPVTGANVPAVSNATNASQPTTAGVNAPDTTTQAPSDTTEQSVRDEISRVSSSNPYGLPSVDQENAKRAELEKQGAFGTKTKEFERFQDSKSRRSDADALKEQYASGAMGKEEFMERGMAIKGATKKSLEDIINANEKVDSVEPSTKAADDKIASNNKRILDEARARGALDSRDANSFSDVSLEERQAKFEVEKKQRDEDRGALISSAMDSVRKSDERIAGLAELRTKTKDDNEARSVAIQQESELMKREQKNIRKSYERAGELGYSGLDMINPYSENRPTPFAPPSAVNPSALWDDVTTEINKRNPDVANRTKDIQKLYGEVKNIDESFNAALGGGEVTYKGVKYQGGYKSPDDDGSFPIIKGKALKGDKDSASAQFKIITTAIDEGYPIELDKELMASPEFVSQLNSIKQQRGITKPLNTYFSSDSNKALREEQARRKAINDKEKTARKEVANRYSNPAEFGWI